MSATLKVPFNRADATPQSIQKLLDENAQLIRVLVENMNSKGKATECIQYQQTLHRNLTFLASLADPSLNLQTILPPPGTAMFGQPPSQYLHQQSPKQQQQQSSQKSQLQPPASTTSGPGAVSASPTSSSLANPPPPSSLPPQSTAAPSSSSSSPSSSAPSASSPSAAMMSGSRSGSQAQQQMPSRPSQGSPHHQQTRQQPQATMQGSNVSASSVSTPSSEVHWSGTVGTSHPTQRPPVVSMDATGQYGGIKQAYSGGAAWGPPGQPGMYGMQRAPSMMGAPGGSGYPPMGGPGGMMRDEHQRQRLLRLRQEQFIQAHQARRLQQQQAQQQQQQVQGGMHAAAAAAGAMYPGAGGMMPPPPPHPHAHPHQGGMPPGYPQQSRMTPPSMPPGPMPM